MRALKAIERGSGTTGPLCCSGVELRAMCGELRRLRRAMRTVIEESRCGRSVRLMRSALRHDLCGVVDSRNAIAADGFAIRGLADLEHMAAAAADRLVGVAARELATLIAEIRRHRRKLYELQKTAADCPRTRAFSARVLTRNAWASAMDAATYPPLADVQARDASAGALPVSRRAG